MIAFSPIPEKYAEWNRRHGAPEGHRLNLPRWKRWIYPEATKEKMRGPFALQKNNSIRQFEYPWAFDVARLQSGMRVLEIGGGLSGFQFILDQFGCQVVNVDPGMADEGWPCDQNSMAKLNRRFGSHVELRNTTVDKVNLPDSNFDRIFSISVIEHLAHADAGQVMLHANRCLKTGGLFVLTCDLFLNLAPFCSRQRNEYGANQNLKSLIDESLWEIVAGDRKCLHGFPEFDPDFILSNLEKFMIGFYPALAQCLVLKKR